MLHPGSSMGTLNRNGEAFMFRLINNTRFVAQNITLDGGVDYIEDASGKVAFTTSGIPMYGPDSFISRKDGFLFQMTNSPRLTLGDGATLQNAFTTHMWGGGAICFGQSANGAVVTMEAGSRIYRCSSGETANPNNANDYGGVGGAIAICKTSGTGNNTININGGTIEQCWAQREGGAIYVAKSGNELYLNGATIKDCTASHGGGIYLDNKATGGDYTRDSASSIHVQGQSPSIPFLIFLFHTTPSFSPDWSGDNPG